MIFFSVNSTYYLVRMSDRKFVLFFVELVKLYDKRYDYLNN